MTMYTRPASYKIAINSRFWLLDNQNHNHANRAGSYICGLYICGTIIIG